MDGRLLVQNYATGVEHSASAPTIDILDRLGSWTTTKDLTRALPERDPAEIRKTVALLLDRTLLESSNRRSDPRELALRRWESWNPEAGFFHMATKDVEYVETEELWNPEITIRSHPAALKSYPGAPRLALEPFDRDGELAGVLLARRTWRRFGDERLEADAVSKLLGLTWGVQFWLDRAENRRLAFKTSPSGGARHSIEVYLMAFAVDGIPAGTYHYCPDTHSLALIHESASSSLLEEFFPTQAWYHRPGAVVLQTSMFNRVQWKYGYPRAYRVVLLEAGHLCQTFCLLATWLGLAPFCTAALGDAAIERHLGIDGISESVIYAAGVGSRPQGVEWAPFEHAHAPRKTMPGHAKRRGTAT